MDLMEAKGYLQAVADNWNDAPKAQRAIKTVLEYVDSCYDEQNRLLGEIAAQHEIMSGLSLEISKRNEMIEAMRDELEVSRKKCQRLLEANKKLDDRIECLLIM